MNLQGSSDNVNVNLNLLQDNIQSLKIEVLKSDKGSKNTL